nr:MAG TPA: hypothetical protein [Caudoviricetes sp.]
MFRGMRSAAESTRNFTRAQSRNRSRSSGT